MADQIKLVQGDITQQRVDAIVNAANTGLVGGGGVDGAIHRAGGPQIMAECDRIRRRKGGCPTGSAVLTTAGRMAAKAVIHTAGPRWGGGNKGEPKLLASCYRSALALAAEHDLRTVAFPSISTGIYGYPVTAAARVAIEAVAGVLDDEPARFDEVRFVLFSTEDLRTYGSTLDEIRGG